MAQDGLQWLYHLSSKSSSKSLSSCNSKRGFKIPFYCSQVIEFQRQKVISNISLWLKIRKMQNTKICTISLINMLMFWLHEPRNSFLLYNCFQHSHKYGQYSSILTTRVNMTSKPSLEKTQIIQNWS